MTVVAIDGPAAAGKSTVAREVARVLGWPYVDTGAMYRALALAALTRGIDPGAGPALGRLAADVRIEADGDKVVVDGEDVTERIRAAEVTRAVSQISAHPEVRSVIAGLQRRLAGASDVVMEGRDIGTAVAPNAQVKIYLTAPIEIRARRRCRQLGLPEESKTLEELEASLEARDSSDASRAASPLAKAVGAVTIDSANKNVDEVVALIVERVRSLAGE